MIKDTLKENQTMLVTIDGEVTVLPSVTITGIKKSAKGTVFGTCRIGKTLHGVTVTEKEGVWKSNWQMTI